MGIVEQVAKAFAAEYWGPTHWETFADEMRDELMRCQRAAISRILDLMEEPSEGMIREGFEEYPCVWTAAVTPEDRRGIWQAMLSQFRKEVGEGDA